MRDGADRRRPRRPRRARCSSASRSAPPTSFAVRGLRLWSESVFASFAALHKLSIGAELSPLFLGVGYLIGARIAAIMLGGGLLAWVVLIPAFDLLLGTTAARLARLAATIRRARRVADLARLRALRRRRGGGLRRPLSSIARAAPVMWRALASARRSPARPTRGSAAAHRARPVLGHRASAAPLALGLHWLLPAFEMRLPEVLLALLFTFFFVVVSARIVGLIGTTSQPVSGMTITALLGTAFVLRALGYDGPTGIGATIRVAAIVCTADRAGRRHQPGPQVRRAGRRDAARRSSSAR